MRLPVRSCTVDWQSKAREAQQEANKALREAHQAVRAMAAAADSQSPAVRRHYIISQHNVAVLALALHLLAEYLGRVCLCSLFYSSDIMQRCISCTPDQLSR